MGGAHDDDLVGINEPVFRQQRQRAVCIDDPDQTIEPTDIRLAQDAAGRETVDRERRDARFIEDPNPIGHRVGRSTEAGAGVQKDDNGIPLVGLWQP